MKLCSPIQNNIGSNFGFRLNFVTCEYILGNTFLTLDLFSTLNSPLFENVSRSFSSELLDSFQ